MASQSLYRKWRSQSFAEVVGQDPITQTLRNSLSTGRIAHAYLFCGPRGTGKTSTGRILAKALNCLRREGGEPCNSCEMCRAITEGRALDLVEIDAASNRGIDEIRDLREKVRFSPAEGRYKVYIIDEVHMLTTDAFNALLKTLEEPPAHVVFVLCTTEAHKVPATVMSRCQRFDFRRVPLAAAVGRLRFGSEQEGVAIDDASLELIAKASTGSMRDAWNLIDQLVSYYGNHIGSSQVRDLLGMAGDARMMDLVGSLVRAELSDALRVVGDVVADGLDLRQFNRQFVDQLRRVLLVKVGSASIVEASHEELVDLEGLARAISVDDLMEATKLFSQLDLRYDGQSSLPIELALVQSVVGRNRTGKEPVADPGAGTASFVVVADRPIRHEVEAGRPTQFVSSRQDESVSSSAEGDSNAEPAAVPAQTAEDEAAGPVGIPSGSGTVESPYLDDSNPTGFVRANWPKVLELLRSQNKVLETYIADRNAAFPFAVEGEKIILGVGYDVHKTTLERPQAKKIVEDVIGRVLGKKFFIQCVVLPRDEEERLKKAAEDPVIQEALKLGAKIIKVE